ncbi:MAG: 4-hydroxy-tetrahydrodipicolinate synthase [Pseudomonadota bacterium]
MSTLFTPRGSWVALVTPLAADGSIEPGDLGGLLDRHVAAGTDGIVLAGTTGESAALETQEFRLLLDAGLRAVDGRRPVLAGVGAASTAKAVKLARIAEEAGVDGMLCVTPYYLRTTQAGLEAHYHALAEAVDLPIVLYNVPSRTGVDLLPETVAGLSRLESIVAIKEAVPDAARVERLVADCAPDFAVLSGDDASALDALKSGAVGVISVTANVVPALLHRLCQLAGEDLAAAEALQERLQPLHAALMEEPNPIPVKAALAELGLLQPVLRRPLVPASTTVLAKLRVLLDEFRNDLL